MQTPTRRVLDSVAQARAEHPDNTRPVHADISGSIEVSKNADMIVLDRIPFDLVELNLADRIADMRVTKTLFEGEVVFDATE